MWRRSLAAGVAICAVGALAPALAGAAPALQGEYEVEGTPGRLTVGIGGNAWVSVPGVAHDLARVETNGTVTHFDHPNVVNALGYAALATAPDGRIWGTVNGAVVSFDPADPVGTATTLPIAQMVTADELTFGPGGRLYALGFDGAAARIFIVDTTTAPGTLINAGGTVVTGVQTPRGIAASTDGLLWVGDFGGNQIVSFDPATNATVAYPVGGGVQDVGAGPVGQIGYTVPNVILGRLSAGGTPQPTTVIGSDSFGIVLGNDGAYWAPGFVSAKAVRMTTGGVATEPITFSGANPGPRRVAAGPDNTVWYSLEFPGETKGKVARITGVEPPPPGGGGPGAGEVGAPRITNMVAPKRVRVGKPIRLRMTVSQPSTLRVRVDRMLPGRRAAGGRCVAPRPALSRARVCVRYVRVAATGFRRPAGTVRLAVGPRIGTARLTQGRYRVGVSARNAAGRTSAWRNVVVRVLR
jgi:hypothetical protein